MEALRAVAAVTKLASTRWLTRILAGRWGIFLLLAPAACFLAVFYLVPLARIVMLSLGAEDGALAGYVAVLREPVYLTVLWDTVVLSGGVALLALLLGYPLAYLMARSEGRVQRVLMMTVLASLWLSVLVRSYAWMVLLARHGPVNAIAQKTGLADEPMDLLYNDISVYIGMLHVMLPFMVLPLYTVMRRFDMGLLRAARSLGASRGLAFWFIFFPASIPGVLAGTLLVFVISLGFFITPALLGGVGNLTFVMLIEQEVTQFLNWERAAVMSIVLLVATIALVLVYRRLLMGAGSGKSTSAGGALVRGAQRLIWSWVQPLERWRRRRSERGLPRSAIGAIGVTVGLLVALIQRALPWLVVGFLVLPLTVVVPLSFSDSPFLEFPPPGWSTRWYEVVLSGPGWVGPIWTSVKIALMVALLATVMGIMAAIPLVRSRLSVRAVLMGVMVSPIVVPVMVLAIALHHFMVQLGLSGSLVSLIVSHTVLALPFVLVVMAGALETVDVQLEQAARTLGASPTVAFMRVTLPLLRPAALTSALFAFLVSFDELVMALFMAGPTTKTLPKRLWEAVHEEIDPATAAVAVLITGVCLLGLFCAEVVRSRSDARRAAMAGGRPEAMRAQGMFR